jgi:hypothetical protein
MRQLSIISRSALSLLAAVWLGGTMNAAAADDVKFPKACTERDVTAVALIENHRSAVAPRADDETLSKAGVMLIEARVRCYIGREAESIAIYDQIVATLRPVPAGQTR